MNKKIFYLFIIFHIIILACKTSSSENANTSIREPAVAGAFYSSNPANLKEQINSFLNSAKKTTIENKLIGLIVPHAGYFYSGQVAAHAYAQLKDKKVDTVIILGSSHRYPLHTPSIYLKGEYKTPLGKVSINEKLAKKIKKQIPSITFIPNAHIQEHSIEVQIPFLQTVLEDDFRIVPILTGQINEDVLKNLPNMLYNILQEEKNIIIIASSDFSHYPDKKNAEKVDMETIDIIKAFNNKKLIERENYVNVSGIPNLRTYQCGLVPIIVLLETAKKFEKKSVTLLNYKNSGDISGDKSRVVGYASIAVVNR